MDAQGWIYWGNIVFFTVAIVWNERKGNKERNKK